MTVSYMEGCQLSWYSSNAAYYDVSLQDNAGRVIGLATGTTGTVIDVPAKQLSEGSYLFFVTPYNNNGIAGSTEWLEFKVVSSNIQSDYIQADPMQNDLFEYLGASLNSVVSRFDDMWNCDATDCIEYSNGTIIVASYDSENVSYISLESDSNYSICGVSVGQSLNEASSILTQNGWQRVYNSWSDGYFQDSAGHYLTLWAGSNNYIFSVSVSTEP